MHKNDRLNHQTAAEAIELRDYIRGLNDKGNGAFLLTLSLDHWAGYGIYTKDQLGDYLDRCVERECGSDDEIADYSACDPYEPNWDMVSRHDMNEGW